MYDSIATAIRDNIGDTLYGIASALVGTDPYRYRLYAKEYVIDEIRIGRAFAYRESDEDIDLKTYGPGEITYACSDAKGNVTAYSPEGDEIVANDCIAGRQRRLFRDKAALVDEAEIVRKLMLERYRNVGNVDIAITR